MERPSLDSTLLHITRLRLTQDYPTQISSCLKVLDEQQVWWRPNEQSNAVGNLILHLVGSNHFYLDHAIGGLSLDRERDREFTDRASRSTTELAAHWEASVASTARVLASLRASQMNETTDRTGKPTTIAQILMHVTHHNATHMGQIVWITKMLEAGSLNDLWMQMRTK